MAFARIPLFRSLGWMVVGLFGALGAAQAQTYNDGFDPNSQANIYAMVRQPDGKIVVGGGFAYFEPDHAGNLVYRERIARINRDGTIDSTFTAYTNGDISAMALQPDGRIIIAGKFTTVGDSQNQYARDGLARLNADGTVDPTLVQINPVGVGAFPYANFPLPIIRAVALQADGKILIGGAFISLQPEGASAPIARSRLARLNADGTVDTSFDVGADNTVLALLVESDGDIVIGGGFTKIRSTGAEAAETRERIARVTSAGILDTVLTASLNERVLALAEQADGKIIAGGEFTSVTGVANASSTLGRLIRFNADGSRDSSFLTYASSAVESITIQSDGRIIVGGRFGTIRPNSSSSANRNGYLSRLFVDGTIDTDFIPGVNGPVTVTVVQPDGTIIAVGYFSGVGSTAGARRGRIARLEADGTLDMAYRAQNTGSVFAIEREVGGEAAGNFLVAGSYSTMAGVTRTALARISPEGVVSSTFSPTFNGPVNVIIPQSNGTIFVGGGFTRINNHTHAYFARLTPEGELDETFDSAPNGEVRAARVQSDGKVLIGGGFTMLRSDEDENNDSKVDENDLVSRRFIARLNTDGTPDDTFDPNANGAVTSIAIESDERILIAGDFTALQPNGAKNVTAYYYIARLGKDGSADVNFLPRPNAPVSALRIEPDGKITVGGSFTAFLPNTAKETVSRTYMARLNADATIDTTFDAKFNGAVRGFDRFQDGRYVAFGEFNNFKLPDDSWKGQRFLAWLTPTGALDMSRTAAPDAVPTVVRILSESDQSVFVGGTMTRFTNGSGEIRLVSELLTRITTAGEVDTTFALSPGDLGAAHISALAAQVGGKIFAGGAFSGIGGSSNQGIVRLAVDGNADTAFSTVANGSVDAIVALETSDDEEEEGGPIAWLEADGRYRESFSRTGAAAISGSIYSFVRANDGTLIVGGDFSNTAVTSGTNLARINSDGTPDTTFNPKPDGAVQSIALLSDGRFVVAGSFTKFGDIALAYLARFNADGTLDTSWRPTPNTSVTQVVALSDGSVLVSGGFASFTPNGASTSVSRPYVARIKMDGTVDTTFNPEVNGSVSRAALQADGKILLAGSFTTVKGKARQYLARVNSEGVLDETFYPKPDNSVDRLAVLSSETSSGKIVIGGRFSSLTPNDGSTTVKRLALALLNADGTVDTSLYAEPNDGVFSLAEDSNGRILVSGAFTAFKIGDDETVVRRNRIARFNADGSIDPLFNPNANASINIVVPQTDGSLVIAGGFDRLRRPSTVIAGGSFTTVSDAPIAYLARLNDDGTADSLYTPAPDAPVRTLSEQSDGMLLVGGEFTSIGAVSQAYLARLDSDGVPDPAFAPVIDGPVHAMAVQADDLVLIGGAFATVGGASRTRLARVLSDGSVDGGFSASTDAPVSTIVLQPDGRILIAGAFTQVNGAGRSYLARLASDGTLDSSFAPAINGPVYGVAVQADGAVLVGGDFTSIGGTARARLARLKPDGTLDTAFDVAANGAVRSMLVMRDGRVVLGGSFTQLGGRRLVLTGRLANPTPAIQSGTLSSDLSTFTWENSGSSPVFTSVEIATSDDGHTWTNVDNAALTPSGAWQLTGISGFAENEFNHVRARATQSGGTGGSAGRFEITWAFYGARMVGPATQLNHGGLLAGWESNYWNSTIVPALGTALISGSGSNGSSGGSDGGSGGGSDGGSGGIGSRAAYHLVNFSVRAWPEDNQPFIAGLVITGQTDGRVLMRGVGPGLTQFDVEPVMTSPRVTLFNAQGSMLSTASSWTGDSVVADTAETVGAFPLDPDSDDSAVVRTLAPGAYTLHVDSGSGLNGVALGEVYFAGEEGGLANFSARAPAGAGTAACIAGFVIGGDQPRRLLIRGVGPTLKTLFGLTDAVPDPKLYVFNAKGEVLATNDDWLVQSTGTASEVAAASAHVGAFSLPAAGRDAAVVVELPPGPYTVHVGGAVAGTVLAEIYEIPSAE